MSIYLGTNLISGTQDISGKADIDAGNFNATGKSLISGLGMPSENYISLTLGATGASYTAPANGYYTIKSSSTSAGGYVILTNGTNGMTQIIQTAYNGNAVRIFFPILKGQKVTINYASINLDYFRFVYAEGEQ